MKILIIFMTMLFLTQISLAGEKVVIIIDGDDSTGVLKDFFKQASDDTAKIYERNHYRVIRIEAAKGMNAQDYKKAISELNNVDELAMAIFTHGTIVDAKNVKEGFGAAMTPEQSARFPISHLRADEVETQYQLMDQVGSEVRYAFAMNSQNGRENPNEDWIGLNDLRDSIISLKKKNPAMKVKINAQSCFSSNVTRALFDIPGVEVFTGNSASQVSYVTPLYSTVIKNLDSPAELKYEESSSFSGFFLQELNRGNSYLDSVSVGRQNYLNEMIKSQDLYKNVFPVKSLLIRPQTTVETLLADQCLTKKIQTETISPCPISFRNADVEKFATLAVQPLLQDYLNREIHKDETYVDKMFVFLGCNENQSKAEASIFKNALIALPDHLKSKIDSISQVHLDTILNNLKIHYKSAFEANTPNELASALDKNDSYIDPIKKLANDPNWQENFSKFKTFKVSLLSSDIIKYSSPDALKNLQEESKDYLAKLSVDNTDSAYSQCLKEPLTCKAQGLVSLWSTPFSAIPFSELSESVYLQAKKIVAEKCPTSQFINAKKENLQTMRLKQLECIEKNTPNDPLLRVMALSSVIYTLPTTERSEMCKLLEKEEVKNKKLLKCLSEPSKLGNDDFWAQMNSHYVNGMETLSGQKEIEKRPSQIKK